MGLSGRMINGNVPTLAVGASLVLMSETGKAGMLRILGVTATGTGVTRLKIEVDGVTIYDKDAYYFFVVTASYPTQGMPISSHTGSALTLDANRRLLNLPFNNSLKVTITNIYTQASNIWYSADYTIDV